MSLRPAIFISAVSRELKSARQLVANTLTFLGYEPEWQDLFGTEEGDLRAVLRRRIDSCKGVVQLVGKCYGAEPPSIDEQFSRVSYTQYEALYARSKGRRSGTCFYMKVFLATRMKKRARKKRSCRARTAPGSRLMFIFTIHSAAGKALKPACSSCAMTLPGSGAG